MSLYMYSMIAKEEEYLSGRNTQDIDGNIIATAFGKVSRDDKSLVISVDTQKQAVDKGQKFPADKTFF